MLGRIVDPVYRKAACVKTVFCVLSIGQFFFRPLVNSRRKRKLCFSEHRALTEAPSVRLDLRIY